MPDLTWATPKIAKPKRKAIKDPKEKTPFIFTGRRRKEDPPEKDKHEDKKPPPSQKAATKPTGQADPPQQPKFWERRGNLRSGKRLDH